MKTLLALLLLLAPQAAKAAGMPQLDFANPLTLYQVVWGVGIFIVLYILASRMALPKVGAVLEQRADRVAADLQAAQAAKGEADAAVAELTRTTREARASAQNEIATAVAAAKSAADAQAAVMSAKLDTQIKEAELRIGQAQAAAMGALQQVATATAQDVIARLAGTAIAPASVDQAVVAALAARAARAA